MRERVDSYEAWIHWEGGAHARLDAEEAPSIPVTHPAGHRGRRAEAWTPEELFVGALEGSVMHAFLDAAQNVGLEVLLYESSAMARVREDEEGGAQIIDLLVRPRVAVLGEEAEERARSVFASLTPRLARFMRAELRIEPVVEPWPASSRRRSRTSPGGERNVSTQGG